MKQFSGTLLLSAYLFVALMPSAAKTELFKFGELLAHYQQHKSDTPAISLNGFLRMHYGDAFRVHQKDHNHTQLPGKETPAHSHAIVCGCSVPALPVSFSWVLHPPQDYHQYPLPDEELLRSSELTSGIWQPPRQV